MVGFCDINFGCVCYILWELIRKKNISIIFCYFYEVNLSAESNHYSNQNYTYTVYGEASTVFVHFESLHPITNNN